MTYYTIIQCHTTTATEICWDYEFLLGFGHFFLLTLTYSILLQPEKSTRLQVLASEPFAFFVFTTAKDPKNLPR